MRILFYRLRKFNANLIGCGDNDHDLKIGSKTFSSWWTGKNWPNPMTTNKKKIVNKPSHTVQQTHQYRVSTKKTWLTLGDTIHTRVNKTKMQTEFFICFVKIVIIPMTDEWLLIQHFIAFQPESKSAEEKNRSILHILRNCFRLENVYFPLLFIISSTSDTIQNEWKVISASWYHAVAFTEHVLCYFYAVFSFSSVYFESGFKLLLAYFHEGENKIYF